MYRQSEKNLLSTNISYVF